MLPRVIEVHNLYRSWKVFVSHVPYPHRPVRNDYDLFRAPDPTTLCLAIYAPTELLRRLYRSDVGCRCLVSLWPSLLVQLRLRKHTSELRLARSRFSVLTLPWPPFGFPPGYRNAFAIETYVQLRYALDWHYIACHCLISLFLPCRLDLLSYPFRNSFYRLRLHLYASQFLQIPPTLIERLLTSDKPHQSSHARTEHRSHYIELFITWRHSLSALPTIVIPSSNLYSPYYRRDLLAPVIHKPAVVSCPAFHDTLVLCPLAHIEQLFQDYRSSLMHSRPYRHLACFQVQTGPLACQPSK